MKLKENLLVACLVICVAAVTRIIPHYPNFTAVGAAALFSGAYLRKNSAWLIPVIALFISDLFLNNLIYAQEFPNNYDGFVVFEPSSLWIYGAFIAIVWIGSRFVRKGKILTIIGTSVGASVIFFLVSNFSAWLGSALYAKTAGGLLMAYAAGIPFFWNTLAGDFFFVAIFFGGYALAKSVIPKLVGRTAG
jgi:hypothetical protein